MFEIEFQQLVHFTASDPDCQTIATPPGVVRRLLNAVRIRAISSAVYHTYTRRRPSTPWIVIVAGIIVQRSGSPSTASSIACQAISTSRGVVRQLLNAARIPGVPR